MARKSQAEAPAVPQMTFTESDVKTIDLFAALVQENMRTTSGLTLAQVMQISKTLSDVNTLRNKINDHVMEFVNGRPD